MANKKRKKEAFTGRALVSVGAFLKILQILGLSLGLDALGGTAMTLVTTCILVGGLAVLAIERLDLCAAFAAIAIVGILGTLLSIDNKAFSLIFMLITFGAFAAMLAAMKKKFRILAAAIILLMTVFLVLQIFGVLSLPAPLMTLVLCLIYGAAAVGLYL